MDDTQAHPLARAEERGPVVARTMAVDEEGVGRTIDVGDVGRVHPHLAPIDPLLERLILAGGSEEHTSELQSLMRTSYAVFCLKKKKKTTKTTTHTQHRAQYHQDVK